jgi:hypothetical protein
MKSLFVVAMLALSTSAFANLPSFSSRDFDALSKKADQVAQSRAVSFADSRAETLTGLTKSGAQSLNPRYLGVTSSGCNFTVEVGLFFRSKLTPKANCL